MNYVSFATFLGKIFVKVFVVSLINVFGGAPWYGGQHIGFWGGRSVVPILARAKTLFHYLSHFLYSIFIKNESLLAPLAVYSSTTV